jgi:hypothetical protein
MDITCPVCHEKDKIQKTTAIRRNGVVRQSTSGTAGGVAITPDGFAPVVGSTNLSSVAVSDLARLLAPPDQPKEEKYTAYGVVALELIGLIMFFGGICSGMQDSSGYIMSVIGFALMIIGIFVARDEDHKVKLKEYAAKNAENRSIWQRKMSIYDRCYYCYRCDISFDPETGEHRPLLQSWQLLNQ